MAHHDLAPLTKSDIRDKTDSGSFSRGRSYFRQGRIHETVLRDSTIASQCFGSEMLPYRVQATLAPHGEPGENPRTVSCTCPRGGFCKHIVALLLTWIDDPERFTDRPPLAELLGEKSRDELAVVIERMVQKYPDLERLVELPAMVVSDGTGEGNANVVTVDPGMIRRQVQSAFATIDPYEWGAALGVVKEIQPLLDLGQRYIAAGQWANAQAVFTDLASGAREWIQEGRDDEGEIAGIIADCDASLAACLDAQLELAESDRLPGEARERLIGALYDIWQLDVFVMGGIGLSGEGPEAIARNVNDEERAMVEEWLRDERGDGWSQRSLTGFIILLREQAGLDDEELLNIYRDAELWDDVTAMMLELDRADEAMTIAVRHLTKPTALITFANALIARGGDSIGRALSLVDDRLWETEGNDVYGDVALQGWLIDQYSRHDRPKEALAFAERRFRKQPALQTYLKVRQVAGLPGQEPGVWNDLRPKLDRLLREKEAWGEVVEISLREGHVAAALDASAN